MLSLNLLPSEILKCFESQKGTTLATITVQNFGRVAKTREDSLPTSLLIAKFSSLYRLKLAAAWFARFKRHVWTLRKGSELPLFSPIPVSELQEPEYDLIGLRYVQRQNFASEIDCVRAGKQLLNKSCLHKLDPILVSGVRKGGGGRVGSQPLPH